MPRYLRWIAAATAGITIQFAFFVAVGAIAFGTGEKELKGAVAVVITFISPILTMIAALAVNDWLAARYPLPPKGTSPASDGHEQGSAVRPRADV